jgi:hypothetical protein
MGPRLLVYELGRLGMTPVPSRSTVYRVLVHHGLVSAIARKRRREDYRRWERRGRCSCGSWTSWAHDHRSDDPGWGGGSEADLGDR